MAFKYIALFLLTFAAIKEYEAVSRDTIKIKLNKIQQAALNISGDLHIRVDSLGKFELIIPEECKTKKYCEHIPNYPLKYVSDIVDQMYKWNLKLYGDTDHDETTTHPPAVISSNLCSSVTDKINYQAAIVANIKWQLVLTTPKIKQSFIGVQCRNDTSNDCSSNVYFTKPLVGKCIQKYIDTKAYVLILEEKTVKTAMIQIPSCCSCVAMKS